MTVFFNTRGAGAAYGAFSNSSQYGVELDGAYWRSVDHYVQAQRFACPRTREQIRQAEYGFTGKVIAREQPDALRADWPQVRDSVMEKAIRAKFTAHPELAEALCATGEDEIIDASPLGTYWGAGMAATGQNRLGQILMKIRSELQAGVIAVTGFTAATGKPAENRID